MRIDVSVSMVVFVTFLYLAGADGRDEECFGPELTRLAALQGLSTRRRRGARPQAVYTLYTGKTIKKNPRQGQLEYFEEPMECVYKSSINEYLLHKLVWWII